MKQHLKAKIVFTFGMLLCLSGCWGRRELDTLGIVMGVGLDKAETAGKIEITVQLAHVQKAQAPSSGSSGNAQYINESNTGATTNEIIRDFLHRVSRRLYFPHNQVIILGKDLAAEGVRDNLDFFMRAPETRKTVYILVASGKADEALAAQPSFEKIPASEVARILEQQNNTSDTPIINGYEFATTLISPTTSAVAPIVEVIAKGERRGISISRCAVFKGDKVVGDLSKRETSGFLWMMNKVKTKILKIRVQGEQVELDIRKSVSRIKFKLLADDSVLVRVRVREVGGIGTQTGSVSLADPRMVKLMAKAAEQVTKQEILSAVNKAKKMETDIFGFGDSIAKRYPRRWKTLKNKWNELFKTIKIKIQVEAQVEGTGNISRPLYPLKE